MRQTALETVRRLLRDLPWQRRHEREDEAMGVDGSETLVADGGAQGETVENTHVTNVPDGAGCTEIWEHLSERRDEESNGDA